MPDNSNSLSYKSAGVDIKAGDALIERIKPHVKRTKRPEWLDGLGGFGALFEIPLDRYTKPVLVAGTDGVGTKLKLAQQLNIHDTIGIDLVAMCANDILAQGAEPLFFLDYYATGKLDPDTAEVVIKGIARGCEIAGMSLIGGETAEMPGMYAGEDYDLAGFCVGIVEKDLVINGCEIAPGDCVIALGSSGPHSNGYSLVRKVLEMAGADMDTSIGDTTIAQALMMPTRIYTQSIQDLIESITVKGIAHITGGGIEGNLVRILPENTMACIDTESWQQPEIFTWLADKGNISQAEMYRTFNCGIGLMLVVDSANREEALSSLRASGETAWCAGIIRSHTGKATVKLDG